MKIALIGYGQMGKIIHKLAEKRNHQIVAIIDPTIEDTDKFDKIAKADICIDFSTPKAVLSNFKEIVKYKKDVIIGTTGWLHNLSEIKLLLKKTNCGIIYGSNFSVGMNIFFQINRYAAKLMNKLNSYDVYGYEMHHKRKKDSPSGTAIELTKVLLENIDRKETAQFDRMNREIKPEELHFASIRSGDINGTHFVGYDSTADSIELKHKAKNRNGFALGAILAAEWQIKNHKIGYSNFKDIFEEVVK
ncbi:MAG: 4-hydroxy-tetrahydrodipicolinate reductase [Candidatus Cloacimonadota bacterium]|nr:4-hydroxy-tetrahydrodipicolinate reductase [Candidatus Cloacimonadota bacterium]